MNFALKAGVALAVLVALLSLILAFTGLHRSSPFAAQLAFIVPAILLTIGCIVWALKKSAADTGYLGQLGHGLLVGVVASVLIFGFWLLHLTVLMPGYLDEYKAAAIGWVESSDVPEETRAKQIATLEKTTAVSQSLAGVSGTMGTSLLVSAIAAIFLRRKG